MTLFTIWFDTTTIRVHGTWVYMVGSYMKGSVRFLKEISEIVCYSNNLASLFFYLFG